MKINLVLFLNCAALASARIRHESAEKPLHLNEDDGFWNRVLQFPSSMDTSPPAPAPSDAPVPVPTGAPVPAPTSAPVLAPTNSPVPAPTDAPVPVPTDAPVPVPTDAPVSPPTETPVTAPTSAPIQATLAPAIDTPAPIVPTDAPVKFVQSPAPVVPVAPPTPEPIPETLAPVVDTPAPIIPTDAPVKFVQSPAPVVPVAPPTPAPVPATLAPAVDTPAPIAPTEAPVKFFRSPAPVVPVTPAPVTNPPVGNSPVRTLIESVALQGGAEFEDPDSYQSKALNYVENDLSSQTDEDYIRYYALASIFYASNGTANEFTVDDTSVLRGWITTRGWVTNSSFCTWFGITCLNGAPSAIELQENRMGGIFAPEVQLIGDTLETIDLFSNTFLTTGGPTDDDGNAWIANMSALKNLFFGTTSFKYAGIPTFLNQVSTLEELDFSNSLYSFGPIPGEAFAGLPNLNYIDLGDNTYNTTIPMELASLESLAFFYMDNCNFEVDEPITLDYLLNMPFVEENWMDFTALAGGIPTEIGTVTLLNSLSLSFCGLNGTIPTEFGNLATMDRLWLYQNQLTGTIPLEFEQLGRMQFLYFEGNRLTGSVPEGICGFGNLMELGSDCDAGNAFFVNCTCCTCCGADACGDFT